MFAGILETATEDADKSDFARDIVRERWNLELYRTPPQKGDDVLL
jgi:hypothetical protein